MSHFVHVSRTAVLVSLALAPACHKSHGGSTSIPPTNDTTPPTSDIRFPIGGMMTDADSIHVSGTAADISGVASIRVNGSSATSSDGFATWTAIVPLHHGTNVLEVTATDIFSNTDTHAASVSIENPGTFLLGVSDLAPDLPHNRILAADTLRDAILSIDLADGTRDVLTGMGAGTGPNLADPERLATDLPHGSVIVLDTQSQSLFAVGLSTGNRTLLSGPTLGSGPALQSAHGLALDSGRGHALVAGGPGSTTELIAVALTGGDRTLFSGGGTGTGPDFTSIVDATMDVAHDRILVLDAGSVDLFAVDPVSGDRSIVSGPSVGTGPVFVTPVKLAVDTIANRAYVEDSGLGAILVVNLANGSRAILSDASHGNGAPLRGFAGIAVNPSAGVAYHAAADEVTSVAYASGDRTSLSSNARGGGAAFELPDEILLDQPAGRLLVKDVRDGGHAQDLVAVGLTTGARIVLSTASINPADFHMQGFAFDPSHLSIWGAAPAMGLSRQVLAVYNLFTNRIRVGETVAAPPEVAVDMEISPAGRLFVLASDGIRARPIGGGSHLAPVSDGSHGTGVLFSSQVQREIYDAAHDRLLVTDAGPMPAVFSVDALTGDRTILSGYSVGYGPSFAAPLGVAVDASTGRALVLDSGLLAMVAVDTATGDRTVLTSGSADAVGTGPLFRDPRDLVVDPVRKIAFTANGNAMNGILIVDLVSGDRLLLSR
jgi:DNA-binding beta-propeller fold protein YncE